MKMLKKIAIPVLLLTVIALCFALTACKRECIHEYGEWTVTKEATCTENGEQTRTCALCESIDTAVITATGHTTGDLLCGVCDTEIVSVDSLFPTMDTEGISSVGLVVKDVILSDLDESDPYYSSITTVELAELVLYLDENGTPAAYGQGEAIVTHGDGSTIRNAFFAVTEGDTIYVEVTDEDGTQYVSTSLSAAVESNDQITQAIAMIETVLPSLEAWINDSLLPCFLTPEQPLDTPEITEEQRRAALTAMLDSFFTVKATDGGAVVALDLSIIKDVNDVLSTRKIAQLIDLIGGDGAFLKLQAFIPTVLDFTVRDFITFLNLNLGVDVPALLEALDELAVIITGSPDATLEMLLEIDADLEVILADEDLLATSVKDVIMASAEITDPAELDAAIAQLLELIATKTLYELLGADPALPEQINTAVDAISEMLSYEITVGADGKFASSTLLFNSPDADTYVTLTLTAEKLYFNANDGADTNSVTVEIIPGYEVKLDAERKAALVAKFASLPKLSTDIIDFINNNLYYSYFIPVLENGELSSIIVYSDYTEEIGETEVILNVFLNVIEDPALTTRVELFPGCSGTLEIDYTLPSMYEVRSYVIPIEEYALIEDLYTYTIELVASSAEYALDYQGSDETSILFRYDPVTGKPGNFDHDYVYDEERSIFPESVNCGEEYRDVYVCDRCGDEIVDSYVKEHGYEVVLSAVAYDEASRRYTADYNCICGEFCHTVFINVLGDVALSQKSEVGDEGEKFDLSFNIETAGEYAVTVTYSIGSDGYVHLYQGEDYIDTTYNFASDPTDYVTLEAGEGYLNIYSHVYEDGLEITISIEKLSSSDEM